MTLGLNSGVTNPVSKITISSLKDLGYIVNVGAADTYVLPGTSLLAPQQQGAIRLLNDVWIGPVYEISNDGTVVRVLRR